MKTIFLLAISLFSFNAMADCGYSFGETLEDKALCSAINTESVQDFFKIEETPYTNPATVELFDVKSVTKRTEEEVILQMSLLFEVTYVDSWEPGVEPSLESDECQVYLEKNVDTEDKWVFSYAECEDKGEFSY